MNNKDKIKHFTTMLFSKYQKLTLTPEEVQESIGITVNTLKAARLNGTGIPYVKLNGVARSKPLYSISTIAEEIVKREITTFN